MLIGQMRALSKLTGLDFFIVRASDDPHDLLVLLGDRVDLMRLADRYGPDDGVIDAAPDSARCLSGFHAPNGIIERGIALIATDLGVDLTKSCALHELVHLIGFRNHMDMLQPSILNTRDNLTELSINDRILVQALYDQRLRPGMSRAEALPIAREIIGELVARAAARAD